MTSISDYLDLNILDETRIGLESFKNIQVATRVATGAGLKSGLPKVRIQMLITAICELGNNILIHAGRGEIAVQSIEQAGRKGIRIVASDNGPGIPDIRQAIVDGYTTQPKFSSLGLGLGGVSRLMDEVTIDSQIAQGTRVTAIKWV